MAAASLIRASKQLDRINPIPLGGRAQAAEGEFLGLPFPQGGIAWQCRNPAPETGVAGATCRRFQRPLAMYPLTCPEMTVAAAELVVYAVTTFMAALGLFVTAR